MNIYFLVEGQSSEKKIYPKWLHYLIPELKQVKYYDEVEKNNYYLISGKGYPKILYDGLDNALDKISESNKYDYLVLCVDADEETVDERSDYIKGIIQAKSVDLGKTKIEIIIQNRCIETWLLGNRRMFDSRQNIDPNKNFDLDRNLVKLLPDYINYYDVSQSDPELMGTYEERNHADFHGKYLQAVFQSKNMSYTKKAPGDTQERHYLEQLQKRIADRPTDLGTFQTFLAFCDRVKQKMSEG